MNKEDLLIGAHAFVKGGPASAIYTSDKLGFTAMQLFTKNNNRWTAPPLKDSEIEEFRNALYNSNIKFVVSHDSYLINLCAISPEILEKSRSSFIDELSRCELLGIPYLNFHPGSHGGQGEDEGIRIIIESLNIAHEATKDYKTNSMLELTAGQGTAIGYTFEHLKNIIDGVEDKSRMSICIDTAHAFAAGYNIKDPLAYEKVISHFDSIIGLDWLKCFHMNDSKKDLGTRVDRHDHIGKGFIGLEGFSNIMNDKRLEAIPKILETPKEADQKDDVMNIEALLSLIK
ncbi:MAG: deoxyribonuclease IV [Melioribacteraceae bacterium]|nr:deoxyribonuclease IV [Melioribacteraceae bacterium]